MNDIEIINQVIYTEQGKKMNYIDIDNIIDNECENFIQAIENLIQRNKNLEQIEKEHKEENERLRDKIKDLEYNMILFTNDKEKFNRYKYARDVLEKLLEEE